MKKLDYEGSLIDDLNLINEKEPTDMDIAFKGILSYIALITVDVLWCLLFTLQGHPIIGYSLIGSSSSIFVNIKDSARKKENEKKDKKKDALKRIKKFFKTIFDSESTNDLVNLDSYETLKDAIVVTDSQRVEQEDRRLERLYQDNLKKYYEVVISDIYYLDLDNQIKILREIKEIVLFESKKAKSSYIKYSSLNILEEEDYPSELPVQKLLELNKN